jgi:hypothetical protein
MNLGGMFDSVGTFLNLPEFGWSEGLNNKQATANTGRVGIDQSNLFNTPASRAEWNAINQSQNKGGAPASWNNTTLPAAQGDSSQSASVPGGGYSGGGGVAAAPRPDAEAVAYWNDNIGSLQRLLDSSNTQRGQGIENINNSFNRNLDSINGQESRTLRDYGIKEQDTQTARQDNLQKIGSQARQGNEGLQRLFQLSGAGVSSASQMVAPNAVARDASGKRASTLNTFGKNMRDIDTARTDAKEQFSSSRTDLESQKRQKEQSFIEGILNLQNDLNSKLSNAVTQRGIAQGGTYSGLAGARAQYDGAIRDNQGKIDGLFNQYRDPAFSVRQVQAKVPNLAQYTADPTAIGLAEQNPGIAEELLPYLPGLKEKELGGLL